MLCHMTTTTSCIFLWSTVTSSLLDPTVFLRAPFSNALNLRSSLNVTDQDLHPHRIIVTHTLIFTVLDSKRAYWWRANTKFGTQVAECSLVCANLF